MAKRKPPERKPYLVPLKVYPTTRIMVQMAAEAEGLPIVVFLENLLREWLVERNLHQPTASIIAYQETIIAARKKERDRLKAEVRAEVEAERVKAKT